MSREIIINKMYVGAYLTEGDNIGHEIINLYRADDGGNYIYLNSQGIIPAEHRKKDLTVLLIRKYAPRVYKVLAKAQNITVLDCADNKITRAKRYEIQSKLDLAYGGVPVASLFDNNTYHGNKMDEKNNYVTFKAGILLKPKAQLLITDNEALPELSGAKYIRTNKGFGKTTLREYYDEHEKPDSFSDLISLIEDEDLWEPDNTTLKMCDLTSASVDEHVNFLKLIKQEDHELAFSNMFAHFFYANREAFAFFAKEVLHIDLSYSYTIEREINNIDLLITDDNNVVVIENKIKSSINGVNGRHDLYGELVQSQLQKYYDYITKEKTYKEKAPYFFIFTPNYNRIDTTSFVCGDKYTIIKYSDIHRFYNNNRTLFTNEPYFMDFVNALFKHTKEYDDELEEEMQRRFLKVIQVLRTRAI